MVEQRTKPVVRERRRRPLERQIGRMVAALAAVAESADVVKAVNERRAKIEALKATPPEPERFDRAEFFRRFRGSRAVDMLLCASYPTQVRQAFKRLGVERVVVRPDGSFSGDLDGRAVLGHMGDSGGGRRGPLRCSGRVSE